MVKISEAYAVRGWYERKKSEKYHNSLICVALVSENSLKPILSFSDVLKVQTVILLLQSLKSVHQSYLSSFLLWILLTNLANLLTLVLFICDYYCCPRSLPFIFLFLFLPSLKYIFLIPPFYCLPNCPSIVHVVCVVFCRL